MIKDKISVGFLDLKSQYLSIKDEIDKAIQNVFDSMSFAGGPFVKKFESEFAQAHEANFCVAVNNGTSALHLMMMALDIGLNDEVIVPANTFFASAEAISLTGATPVFVDCDEHFYNIDPDKIEAAISPKTKAILAVHLYGQPARMDTIKLIADRHGLILLEDCAQAHLAKYKNQFVGTFGKAGAFSFYPGKNLGAYGEAGAVLTNDEELYHKMQAIKDHGSVKKYYHDFIGHNFRMEALQASILSVKLKYLPEWTSKRRAVADSYGLQLKNLEAVTLPREMEQAVHVYHLFVIQVPDRNSFMEFLTSNGIQTGIHYPIPCHLQKAYEFRNYQIGTFKNSEKFGKRIVSLPMSEQLTDEQISYIAIVAKEYLRS